MKPAISLSKLLSGVTLLCIGICFFDWWQKGYIFPDPECQKLVSRLSTLNELNPKSDVYKNLKQGNERFFARIVCFPSAAYVKELGGLEFPAVPRNDWRRIYNEKRFIVFLGFTDSLESIYHDELLDRAFNYISKYNIELYKLKHNHLP